MAEVELGAGGQGACHSQTNLLPSLLSLAPNHFLHTFQRGLMPVTADTNESALNAQVTSQ